MRTEKRKLLVIQTAALGYDFLRNLHGKTIGGMEVLPMEPSFPAVTCTAQADFRTGSRPASHGMAANGYFDSPTGRVFFWEQSARLVEGNRIWRELRRNGGTVGMLFWQQSLGEEVDLLLSPAPVHPHHGSLIQAMAEKPHGLYDTLCRRIGRKFDLKRYWGPLASVASSEWIADATARILADPEVAPDLCLTYLPGLDYDLQRFGPAHPRARKALRSVVLQIERITDAARSHGYDVVLYGDYPIEPVTRSPLFPNRILRESGLFAVRTVRGMEYPNLHDSRAFALVDHQVAHLHVRNPDDLPAALACFRGHPGIGEILAGADLRNAQIENPRAGNALLVAESGGWFAYPWWEKDGDSPDFARHVDIHNKPGFDPCELFFGWPPGSVTRNHDRIRGTHGRRDVAHPVGFASTCFDAPENPASLGLSVAKWLNSPHSHSVVNRSENGIGGTASRPEVYRQEFRVSFDYPVVFTRNVFDPGNPTLAKTICRKEDDERHRVLVCVDSGLADAEPGIKERITHYLAAFPDSLERVGPVAVVPGGAVGKTSLPVLQTLVGRMAEARLCRRSFVLAVGGGSMLDVTGLAASLVHRGLRLVRIPTTVLAQADAGVGVKNGIDFFGTKNLAGTFAPPFAVLNDPQFLLTLPREDWIGGFSESFKVAIIEDASFFEDLCRLAPFLAARDQDAAETVIRRTAELHLDHIRLQGDPFEFGAARPLDFGHWAAHRIEVLTEYAVGHGTAVALGIALDTCYATGLGLVAGTDRDRILDALEKTGLPTFHFSLLERDANGRLAILQGISDFREHLGGRLHVTLPRGIGARVDVHEMEDGQVEEALCFLKRRNS